MDPKARILARRSAFVAAAALTANCDRCTSAHPGACLSVAIQDDADTNTDTIPLPRPSICLSAPPNLPVEDAAPADASSKEGGPITLKPIDVNVGDSGVTPPPTPCLSVAIPTPTTTPAPHVCLRRLR